MKFRLEPISLIAAGALLTACATTNPNTIMLRQADQIEQDGRVYSEMLIRYANEHAEPGDKQELLRYSTSILAQTEAVANIVRKQVAWEQ